jgi:predicted nucleotidyltransferase
MKTAGIIAEYNPFHRGHAYQIAQTRRELGEETGILCVMSGNWVQRGECALTDKWTRAGLAIQGGADLVLELPTPWAMSTAETFARGAVELLEGTGVVETLSFGSESGEAGRLKQVAACLDSPAYRAALPRFLGEGRAFAACRQAAVGELLGETLSEVLASPNDNLGVEYLRSLNSFNSGIQPLAILRRGTGHHGGEREPGFAPAKKIRTLLQAGDWAEAESFLPQGESEALQSGQLARLDLCQRAILARLRTMRAEDWVALPDSGAGEGLPERMARVAGQAVSLEECYALAKTKRYSHARLRRLVISAFLGLRAEEIPEHPCYLRVLGCNTRGRQLLREMGQKSRLPILTKPAHARRLEGEGRRLFELEARCTDLFTLCLPRPLPGGMEWTRGPVILE